MTHVEAGADELMAPHKAEFIPEGRSDVADRPPPLPLVESEGRMTTDEVATSDGDAPPSVGGDSSSYGGVPSDSTSKRGALAQPEDPDAEEDPEIVRLEAAGINALVEADKGIPEPQYPEPLPDQQQGEPITIHMVEDGFSFAGRIWYRGEEIICRVGDETYQKTVNRDGDSWFDTTEAEQIDRYEKVMFRKGPWPFERPVAEPSRNEKRQQRQAQAPLPMT